MISLNELITKWAEYIESDLQVFKRTSAAIVSSSEQLENVTEQVSF